MKLIAFDGDDTLWTPLDGVCLSDRTPTDSSGWPSFTYRPLPGDGLVVQREDGARFRLRPEAREVWETLRAAGVLVGVISYNHPGNVTRILAAFGLSDLVDYIVAEWHSDKDRMLTKMLDAARLDGHSLAPADALLVDDDPYRIYRGQCARMGAAFLCFGGDIHDLREVLG